MTDQTPVTDDDRIAHEWCDSPARQSTEALAPIIRAIRAHVPAPPATLADQMRTIADIIGSDFDADAQRLDTLADRVEAVEKDNERLSRDREDQEKALVEHGRLLSDARAEFDKIEALNLNLEADLHEARAEVVAKEDEAIRECHRAYRERDEARAEAERLTGRLAESQAALLRAEDTHRAEVKRLTRDRTVKDSRTVALPDPADVPKGEQWRVKTKVFGVPREVSGIKSSGKLWRVVDDDYMDAHRWDSEVTLISRLVSDTRRVIDRPEDLVKLPSVSVILDGASRVCEKSDSGRWLRLDGLYLTAAEVIESRGPVTVIHEPEVTA